MQCDEFGITEKELKQEYKDVFSGLGTLGKDFNLTLRNDAVPVVHAPRRVPIALREKLKK